MSEKLEKLRAMLEKEKERRIKLNNRIEILLRQSATTTPNPAALAAVGAVFAKEDDSDED